MVISGTCTGTPRDCVEPALRLGPAGEVMAPGGRLEDHEETLLAGIARADHRAFEALYDRYSRSVYSLALTMLGDPQTAQEITQEVFLGIWRAAREFNSRRGTARSWILALAHHKSVDAVRRRRMRAAEPLEEAAGTHMDVDAEALGRVQGSRIRAALMDLSREQREAIVLAYYGGYTQQEIARKLKLPLGTVKTRMRDGMLRLRAALASGVEEIER